LESLPAESSLRRVASVRTIGDRAAHVAGGVELPQHGNQLTSLPATIGQLTSLKRLHLAGNQLTSLPAEVRQLTQLQELSLSYNQLTTLPEWIIELTSLKKLTLDGNQLTSLPAAAIDALTAMGCNLDI